MPNYLTRDQIISQALDMVDSPTLETKERPDGINITGSFGKTWLQRAVDYFHKCFPASGDITSTAVTIPLTGLLTVPANFILDYRDGLLLDGDKGRLKRRGLGTLLDRPLLQLGLPDQYSLRGTTIEVAPHPDVVYTGVLWYYTLPANMVADTVPQFPDEMVLIDYLHLRYSEWLKAVPKGSAQEYAQSQINRMRASGLFEEAEDDQIPLDRQYFGERQNSDESWMGKTTL